MLGKTSLSFAFLRWRFTKRKNVTLYIITRRVYSFVRKRIYLSVNLTENNIFSMPGKIWKLHREFA